MKHNTSRAEDIFNRVRSHGIAAIDEFIVTHASEEYFLDFKRSSDNGSGQRLSQTDRDNLAKCISGFGNSAGGVIVWGVDCSKTNEGADVAHTKHPIVDPRRYASWLNAATSAGVFPPHGSVESIAVLDDTGASGFVITMVPESNHAPHQVLKASRYYIRAGSDFLPAPHQVLAGMFGRRPQPFIYPMFNVAPIRVDGGHVHCQLGIVLRNDGPVPAGDLFATAMIVRVPGNNCKCGLQPPSLNHWDVIASWSQHISVMSKREIRLPPDSQLQPITIEASFKPPFDAAFEVRGTMGAGNVTPTPLMFKAECESVQAAYDEVIRRHKENTLNRPPSDLVSRLMGIVKPE